MQTISIHMGMDNDGQPFIRIVPTDDIDPAAGVEACRTAMEVFREAATEAEVQRRLEAAQAEQAEQGAEQGEG